MGKISDLCDDRGELVNMRRILYMFPRRFAWPSRKALPAIDFDTAEEYDIYPSELTLRCEGSRPEYETCGVRVELAAVVSRLRSSAVPLLKH